MKRIQMNATITTRPDSRRSQTQEPVAGAGQPHLREKPSPQPAPQPQRAATAGYMQTAPRPAASQRTHNTAPAYARPTPHTPEAAAAQSSFRVPAHTPAATQPAQPFFAQPSPAPQPSYPTAPFAQSPAASNTSRAPLEPRTARQPDSAAKATFFRFSDTRDIFLPANANAQRATAPPFFTQENPSHDPPQANIPLPSQDTKQAASPNTAPPPATARDAIPTPAAPRQSYHALQSVLREHEQASRRLRT